MGRTRPHQPSSSSCLRLRMSQLGSTECRSNLDSSGRQPYCRCPTPMCAACTARMAHRQSHSKTRLVPRRARSANQFATSGCMRHVGLRRWDPRKSRPKRCKCRPRRGTPRHQQSRPGPTTSILRHPKIHSSHTEPKLAQRWCERTCRKQAKTHRTEEIIGCTFVHIFYNPRPDLARGRSRFRARTHQS